MLRGIGATVVLFGVLAGGYSLYRWYEDRGVAPVDAASTHATVARNNGMPSLSGLFHRATEGLQGVPPGPTPHFIAGAVYYSPWQNLETIDADAILDSRCSHLDIAMYAFTDWKLAEAVAAFARSGRPVRIYRDREQYEQEVRRHDRALQILDAPNISIKVKRSTVLMHIKAWSDGCILREGSANWSPGGEKQQDNTLVFLDDKASVHNFEADFNAMWNRSNNIVVQQAQR